MPIERTPALDAGGKVGFTATDVPSGYFGVTISAFDAPVGCCSSSGLAAHTQTSASPFSGSLPLNLPAAGQVLRLLARAGSPGDYYWSLVDECEV